RASSTAMPELPEVESLRRVLADEIVGRRIIAAMVTEPRLRRPLSPSLVGRVKGRVIGAINRRAKYLLLDLDTDAILLVHLGMSGSLTVRRDPAAGGALDTRHDHVRFVLDDGRCLIFNDPRRFGLIRLLDRTELAEAEELKGIGPEPFGAEFTIDYLWPLTRGRSTAIKNLLMDQRIVAGVGNIYASEILFRAGVRPTRRARRVTWAEAERIVAITRQVLEEAIGN